MPGCSTASVSRSGVRWWITHTFWKGVDKPSAAKGILSAFDGINLQRHRIVWDLPHGLLLGQICSWHVIYCMSIFCRDRSQYEVKKGFRSPNALKSGVDSSMRQIWRCNWLTIVEKLWRLLRSLNYYIRMLEWVGVLRSTFGGGIYVGCSYRSSGYADLTSFQHTTIMCGEHIGKIWRERFQKWASWLYDDVVWSLMCCSLQLCSVLCIILMILPYPTGHESSEVELVRLVWNSSVKFNQTWSWDCAFDF